MNAAIVPPLDWTPIPAGRAILGVDPVLPALDVPGRRLELPAFQIMRTPVTNAQYAAFTAATGYRPPAHWEGAEPPAALADHPVTYVDWYDAQAYCAWAGGRLPSEAEWEYAARGVDGRRYPWGDAAPTALCCNYGGQIGATTPVGRYAAGASPFGLLDMAGNVWEWTATLARPYPYRAGDGREDPAAAGQRVVRGGSYQHAQHEVRCAARDQLYPDACDVYIGFRMATSNPRPAAPLDWVAVPGGAFLLGDGAAPPAQTLPGLGAPAHLIDLAAFELTRTPVTNAQYAAFTNATGYRPPGHWEGATPPPAIAGHPVTYVDWFDAQAYCAWASGRLPSEAEWEYAARGPDGRPYPWGDAAPDERRACFDRAGDSGGACSVGACPAGASPFGLLDMAGNVWEWTATLARPYPYHAGDGREDPAAAMQRVLRGGSWRSAHARYLHGAFRSLSYPARRRDHIGFRVARTRMGPQV
jgi:formylglycine-generating enzyme required for sulfatase activity